MIRIGHLSLTLPHAYRDRADAISRHAGEALAAHRPDRPYRADTLTGLRIQAPHGATDTDIGRAIASAVIRLTSNSRGGGDA